ncbi:MAG: O-antigen ligase family protein [Nitrospirota bacterium]
MEKGTGAGAPRIIGFFVFFLLIFTAFFSGAVHPWAGDVFIALSMLLFLISLPSADNLNSKRLLPVFLIPGLFCLSAVWTVNLNSTASYIFQFTAYAAFACLAASVGDGGRKFLKVIFFTSVIVALYAIYQYFVGLSNTEAYLRSIATKLPQEEAVRAALMPRNRRAFATMMSPNILGCYLAMAFTIGLGVAFSAKTKRFLYIAGLFIIFAALILTKSLGGFIALFIGIILFFISVPKAKGFLGNHRKKIVVLFLLLFSVCVFSVLSMRSSGDFGFARSLSERMNYWRGAIEIFAAAPMKGFGAGSFELLYPAHIRPGADETRYAHNVLLQALAETGLPGLIAVLAVFITFFASCLMKLRKGQEERTPLVAGVFAAGGVFFIHNMLDFSFYVPETAVLFWFLYGLSTSYAGDEKRGAAAGAALRAAVAIPLLIIGIFYVKSYLAAQKQEEALSMMYMSGITSSTLARQVPAPPDAIRLAEEAVSLKGYDDRYHSFLAGLYEGRSLVDGSMAGKAVAEYNKAIRFNPYYPFYYKDLGLLYYRLGDKPKAVINFELALSRYPASENIRKYLDLAKKR